MLRKGERDQVEGEPGEAPDILDEQEGVTAEQIGEPESRTKLNEEKSSISAVAHYSKGNEQAAKENNHTAAIAEYSRAIELDTSYIEAYYGRGIAHYENARDNRGNIDKSTEQLDYAFDDLSQAIKLNKFHLGAYYSRGLVSYMMADYPPKVIGDVMTLHLDRAYADFSQAILLSSHYAEAYYMRGRVRHQQGAMTSVHTFMWQAIQDFTLAIALNPKLEEAYFQRAEINYQLSQTNTTQASTIQPDTILADCQEVLRLNPEHAGAYFRQSTIYYMQEKLELAFKSCSRTILINPDYAEAYLFRAQLRYERAERYADVKQQERKLARQDVSESVRLNPDLQEAAYDILSFYGGSTYATSVLGLFGSSRPAAEAKSDLKQAKDASRLQKQHVKPPGR